MKLCPCCSGDLTVRKIFDHLPTSSAILNLSPDTNNTAAFDAAICNNCKHITNASDSRFDTIYSDQFYVVKTAVTNSMSANLKLILDFLVKDKSEFSNFSILEIGSGAGEVALWFDQKGANIYTVDPAILGYENSNINHHSINFDNNINRILNRKFDLIICRHIIEHTDDPSDFLKTCNSLLNDNGKIYIEVPNLINTLDTKRLVDFFNDHIQHFTENSLRLLAKKHQLYLEDVKYLLNDAHMGLILYHDSQLEYHNNPKNIDINKLLDQAEEKFERVLNSMMSVDKIVVYGAGAHSCTFASQLSSEIKNKINHVFDRSVSKQGRYLPEIEIPISLPSKENIKDQQLVINTSSLYTTEVENFLLNELGWNGTILHL